MSEHASDLALDELAAGLASAASEHVNACARCTGRLEGFTVERRASLRSPGYQAALQALRQRSERLPFWRRWQLVLPLAASLAAGAFLFVPRLPDRIKGAPSLALVHEGTGEPVKGPAHPGDRLALAVGAAGAPALLVMAVGDDGSIAKLWPIDRAESGPAPKGAAALLSPPFVVTPGSATLFAFFSASPLSSATVERALNAAVAAARRGAKPPSEISVDTLPGESGRAKLQLCVEGSPCSMSR